METRAQLEAELVRIQEWERDQKDLWFWEKLGRLPFLLLDRITPKFVQEKIGLALNELGSYVQTGGQYLISERSILDKLKQESDADPSAPITMAQAAGLPLAVMDRVADDLSGARSRLAAVQGATTGIGGIFTLAIDIPALLGMSLKVLQEIAICYGYDPKEKQERIFVVKCLQFASSDIVGKRAVFEDLDAFTEAAGRQQVVSQLQGWREVIMTYRDNFGWKKLFQLVPIAGILFGAMINKGTVQDVAEAGKMLYRKRRIRERLTQLDAQSNSGSEVNQ